jgi:hypothetical protein
MAQLSVPQYCLNERALFRLIDDEAVILNLDSGQYFGLNAVAVRVWDLLGQGRMSAEICETLLGEYETDRETLAADVDGLLRELAESGLISKVEVT